ncbi:MAG: 2Fe-2S iron-sulfur cluster binding domain-containing protein [Deltaproteobacteria bacterium]|nr:2Fe-2S iron-sulfur cluster binding domain-containing protein [Deltaproteobacteria bacterium]
MGGSSPYIQRGEARKAQQKFSVTFQPANVTVEVDPAKIPYGRDGEPGSILDIALAHGVDIDHACGGVCACSTCHVIVRQGGRSLSEPSDAELDRIEQAPGNTPDSRLACQAVPDGTANLEVEIPGWNRNFAREPAH